MTSDRPREACDFCGSRTAPAVPCPGGVMCADAKACTARVVAEDAAKSREQVVAELRAAGISEADIAAAVERLRRPR